MKNSVKNLILGMLLVFSVSVSAQEVGEPIPTDFILIKTWFIDSRDEVQLQLASKTQRLGLIANLRFTSPNVAYTDYFFYNLDDVNAPVNQFRYTEETMKVVFLDAVTKRSHLVETNVYPKIVRYMGGEQAVVQPSVMSPYFPVYIPTETPPTSAQAEINYYELLQKRFAVVRFENVKQCLQLFSM